MPSNSYPIEKRAVELTVFLLANGFRKTCPVCHEKLELHQPDSGKPDRLLAVCGPCGCWYDVNLGAGIMTLLSE